MEKNKKISDKAMLAIGLGLIVFVVIVTALRRVDFSFLRNIKGSSASSQDALSPAASKIDYTTIASKDVQIQTLTSQKIMLLDIRPFTDYAREHIVDSVNVSVDEFPMDQKYDRSEEVIVIGASADDPDIETAVHELEAENFSDIKVLAGGIEQWKNLAGATVSYGDPTSVTDQAKVNYVTTDQINDALNKNTELVIVDVRSQDDYAKSHLKDSINIPFDDLEKRRFDINTSSGSVFFVGINELQEFEAAVQVHDMLLTRTYVMKGGMPEWIQKNFPVQTN